MEIEYSGSGRHSGDLTRIRKNYYQCSPGAPTPIREPPERMTGTLEYDKGTFTLEDALSCTAVNLRILTEGDQMLDDPTVTRCSQTSSGKVAI